MYFIYCLQTIVELNLSFKKITDAGAEVLLKALKNSNVRSSWIIFFGSFY